MLKNVAFISGAALGARLVGLASFLLFARTLGPEVFGAFSLLVMLRQLFTLVGMHGHREGMLYANRRGERAEPAAWRLLWLINGSLCALAFFLAPFLGSVVGIEVPARFVWIVGLLALVQPLHVVAQYRLDTAERFGTTAIVDFVAALCGLLAAGVVFLLGGTVETLLATMVVNDARAIVLFALARRVEEPTAPACRLAALLRYMYPLTATQLLNFVVENTDKLLVGSVLGSAALGIYSRAQQLVLTLVVAINSAVRRVLFAPLVARGERSGGVGLSEAFESGTSLLVTAAFPLLLCAQLLMAPFETWVLGPEWEGFVLLSRLFLAGMLAQLVGGWLLLSFSATGRTSALLRVTLLTKGSLLAVVLVAAPLGVAELAMGIAVARTLNVLVLMKLGGFGALWRPVYMRLAAAQAVLVALPFLASDASALPWGATFWALSALLAAGLIGTWLVGGGMNDLSAIMRRRSA